MSEFVVAVTGTSGSVYGLRLVERLLASGSSVTFVATPEGRDIMAVEAGLTLPMTGAEETLVRFLELQPGSPLRIAQANDLSDRLVSGSRASDAMVVCPASMDFVGAVASGTASDLPERVASVMLKERLPLILVPRETPLSLIQLRNLTTCAEAGAVVLPAMPAFYHKPRGLDDQVDFVVGKVLDVLGMEHSLFRRWGSES